MDGAHVKRVILALWLTACSTDLAASSAEIVSGAPSSDPPTVAIVRRRTSCGDDAATVTCTGTLLAPRVVLTAAHCLEEIRSPGELEVFFGDVVGSAGTFIPVSAFGRDPSWDPETNEHDAAVLALASDAPVGRRALPTASVADLAPGATLRAIGYGVTNVRTSDFGVQREGTLTLSNVRAGSFDAIGAPSMTCQGDSGGPVLATISGSEQLVGITSRGDPSCAEYAFNVRADAVLDSLVRPWIAAIGDLPPAWPADAPALEDLATFECARDEDCPALLSCGEDLEGALRCQLPGLGPGAFGATCSSDASCANATCARVWTDECRCFTSAAPIPPPPPPGGGCAISGGGSSSFAWILLALAMRPSRGGRRRRSART